MHPPRFDQLDVYRTAIRYVGQTRSFVLRLKREDPTMSDQMHRAVLSIPLYLAEGAGEFIAGDTTRLYRYAVRSAAETIAVLDCARELELIPAEEHAQCRGTALRIMAMLTGLCISIVKRDKDQRRGRDRDENDRDDKDRDDKDRDDKDRDDKDRDGVRVRVRKRVRERRDDGG
jgi:four helix bundle protein